MDAAPLAIPRRRSIALWSILALAMVAFSYALTIFLALAFVFLPWLWLAASANIGSIAVFICGLLICLTMLWSVVPRIDRFRAPGPRLDEEREARLFREIRQIAVQLSEPMPDEIYLVNNVNAGVIVRGGFLGFRSRRILVLGLPLFSLLTVAELRAVLAHEFAHYYGGDTHLLRWVYAAHKATSRTLARLAGESSMGSFMKELSPATMVLLPYMVVVLLLAGYWRLFLQATASLSQKQEYRADELASLIAGGAELARGLVRIEGATPILPAFWMQDMVPPLVAGIRPPFTDGFLQRMQAPSAVESARLRVEEELNNPRHRLLRTHPPLRDRLAAMARYPAKDAPDGADPATVLLNEIDALEKELLQVMLPKTSIAKLRPVQWGEVGMWVCLPRWIALTVTYRSLLDGWKVVDLPALLDQLPDIKARMRDGKGILLTRDQRDQRARDFISQALTLALLGRGWKLNAVPGQLFVARGEARLDPTAAVAGILSNPQERSGWAEKARSLGIDDIPMYLKSGSK
jgi:heat shock protein HtpX